MVKIARDYGHHKIFWELSDVDTRPPDSMLLQLHQVQSVVSRRLVVSFIYICIMYFALIYFYC